MKILRETYKKYLTRKDELTELMEDASRRKNKAAEEGDLSENADYQKAFTDLELYTEEYLTVVEIVETGEPVEETTNFNEIGVGSKFKIKMRLLAKPLSEGQTIKLGAFDVKDNEGENSTELEGIITIGGPSNNYVYDGILSTDSVLGKHLVGKPLGKYTLNNSQGEVLEVVAEHC